MGKPNLVTVDEGKLEEFCRSVVEMRQPSGAAVVDYDRLKHVLALGLGFIDPATPYGRELFNALCRLTVTTAIEAVCLRWGTGTDKLSVLMTKRGPDEAYPVEWHCPGSAMRPGETIEDVFARLSREEFHSDLTDCVHVHTFNNVGERRGHWRSEVYLCRVKAGSLGIWFPVDELPAQTSLHHRMVVIPTAVQEFRRGSPWR